LKQKLIYIGTSHSIIGKLKESGLFDFSKAICEEKRVSGLYKETLRKYEVELFTFTNKIDFERIINKFNKSDFIFLIYQLDMIVPANLANTYLFFNLHAGNLATNRGAHPIIWSILNNDSNTELTLHKINEKIDQGLVLGTYPVDIKQDDDAIVIKLNMEKGLFYLFENLISHVKGENVGLPAKGGIYHKPIQEKDYTIDIFNDSKSTILNKIRSQKQYNGAILYYTNIRFNILQLLEWVDTKCDSFEIKIINNVIKVKRHDSIFDLEFSKAKEQ